MIYVRMNCEIDHQFFLNALLFIVIQAKRLHEGTDMRNNNNGSTNENRCRGANPFYLFQSIPGMAAKTKNPQKTAPLIFVCHC